jgi:hypothetical protein
MLNSSVIIKSVQIICEKSITCGRKFIMQAILAFSSYFFILLLPELLTGVIPLLCDAYAPELPLVSIGRNTTSSIFHVLPSSFVYGLVDWTIPFGAAVNRPVPPTAGSGSFKVTVTFQ